MSPSMALFRSCLLFILSIFILSPRVRPISSLRPAFSMRYSAIAAGPVTTKVPSLKYGKSLKVQSLASFSLYLLHQSGVKNRSSQSICNTSQSSLATCAFARTGQYPSSNLTLKVFSSSRLYGRISKNIYYFGWETGGLLDSIRGEQSRKKEVYERVDGGSQQKRMSLLSLSENLGLKLRDRFMKGSIGSSRRNSKLRQKSYCKTSICLLFWAPAENRPDVSLPCFTYYLSSIHFYSSEWDCPSVLQSFELRKERSSITLKILGCLPNFSVLLFTKVRSTPTPSLRWDQKSKQCCSAILSWQQQSSRVFLGTSSMLAASQRLTFLRFLGPPVQVLCSALHSFTNSMASLTLLSLLRSSLELPFRWGLALPEQRSRMKVGQSRDRFTF